MHGRKYEFEFGVKPDKRRDLDNAARRTHLESAKAIVNNERNNVYSIANRNFLQMQSKIACYDQCFPAREPCRIKPGDSREPWPESRTRVLEQYSNNGNTDGGTI